MKNLIKVSTVLTLLVTSTFTFANEDYQNPGQINVDRQCAYLDRVIGIYSSMVDRYEARYQKYNCGEISVSPIPATPGKRVSTGNRYSGLCNAYERMIIRFEGVVADKEDEAIALGCDL